MDCLRFAICAHETISEDQFRIFPNALMTAKGGQIPAHESISEDPMRILRNALMSTENVYEKMDQNHCAHESMQEDHFESRVASRTWERSLWGNSGTLYRHWPFIPVDTLCELF